MNITLHSAFTRHPKFARLSDVAFRSWFKLDGYCCEHLTDGVVPKSALRELGVSPRLLAELVTPPPGYETGLLEDRGDVVVIHDFFDWNDTKEAVQAARRGLRDRVRRHRASRNGSGNGSRNGNGNGVTRTVGNAVCTEGDSGLRTSNKNSPQPPSPSEGGAPAKPTRITRAERKRAEELLKARGYCPHSPQCRNHHECLVVTVMAWRQQETDALGAYREPEVQ